MFIGQHGSWNRSELSEYKVIFIPFKNGRPSGKPEDFLTGFIASKEKNEVYGRPVAVAVLPNGSLLVTDDATKTIWTVSVDKQLTKHIQCKYNGYDVWFVEQNRPNLTLGAAFS